MLDTPQIVQSTALQTATIRFTIPRAEIQKVMGPAIGEVMAAVAAQGLTPSGPVFSYHFKMTPDIFDFEVGVPVAKPFSPTGRVKPSQLPAKKVARTTYYGAYEGLSSAWGEFSAWIAAQKLTPAEDLWEFYVTGPGNDPNPATWSTELNRPLQN